MLEGIEMAILDRFRVPEGDSNLLLSCCFEVLQVLKLCIYSYEMFAKLKMKVVNFQNCCNYVICYILCFVWHLFAERYIKVNGNQLLLPMSHLNQPCRVSHFVFEVSLPGGVGLLLVLRQSSDTGKQSGKN